MPFNVLSVLVATVSAFIVGGAWYSPILFGNPWMRHAGLTEEQLQSGVARIMGTAFFLELVIAVNLAAFLGDADLTWGLTAGALAGGGWVATGLGVTYLFSRKSLALFLIDGGYHLVAFTLMGGIIGGWP